MSGERDIISATLLTVVLCLSMLTSTQCQSTSTHYVFWTRLNIANSDLLPPSCDGNAVAVSNTQILKHGAANFDYTGPDEMVQTQMLQLNIQAVPGSVQSLYSWSAVAGIPTSPHTAQASAYSTIRQQWMLFGGQIVDDSGGTFYTNDV